MPLDWFTSGVFHFRLVATLCQLANATVEDARRRFALQYLVTSNVITESNFRAQLNASVNRLFETTTMQYRQVVDAMRLFTHVDQPYTGSNRYMSPSFNAKLVVNLTNGRVTGQTLYEVCLRSKQERRK